jgi:uncharacterized protein YggT (Ycf19 family)
MKETLVVLAPIVRVIFIVLDIINWTVLVWVILSWILFFASQTSFRWRNRGAYNLLVQLNDIFARMTYPLLRPFRRMLRRFDTAGIDWSPLLLWVTIWLVRAILEGVWGLILMKSV